MSVRDGDLPGDDDERPVSATIGRGRIVALTVGLAVVLVGVAYLVTAQLSDTDEMTVNKAPGALAPMVPVTPPSATAGTGPAPSSAPFTSPFSSPFSSPAPLSASASASASALRKKIDAARATAAAEGHPLQRPPLSAAGEPVDPGAITTTMRDTAEGTVRITTAKADLAGQSTLLLAGDKGTPAGDGRCTQKLRFSNADARVMPTMLLCWRTSAQRSVITLATARTGKPSTAVSLSVLDREWSKLG